MWGGVPAEHIVRDTFRGGKVHTVYIHKTLHSNTSVRVYTRCFVCCAMQLSVKAVYLCFFTAVLWCRGIHLYLIWSGTMCERGATFHKNGGTTTHWRGFAPGRNQNHYTTIYHHHYITLPLHYITLDYTTLPWHHHISSSSAQRPPNQTAVVRFLEISPHNVASKPISCKTRHITGSPAHH